MLFKVCVSLFVFWMICPLMYYCHFPFFFGAVFHLCIGMLLWWVRICLQLLHLPGLITWSLYSVLLVFYTNLYSKVYFCFTWVLLLQLSFDLHLHGIPFSIHTDFQSEFVPTFEVDLLKTAYIKFSWFYPFSQSEWSIWLEHLIHLCLEHLIHLCLK